MTNYNNLFLIKRCLQNNEPTKPVNSAVTEYCGASLSSFPDLLTYTREQALVSSAGKKKLHILSILQEMNTILGVKKKSKTKIETKQDEE